MYKTKQQLIDEMRQVKAAGIKLSRTQKQAWEIRKTRNERYVPQTSRYLPDIAKRAGITNPDLWHSIESRYIERIKAANHEWRIRAEHSDVELEIVDLDSGLALLHCEGWRYYSRQFGHRFAKLSYLVGTDDNGAFVARVPGTCVFVYQALNALVPAEVKRAQDNGRQVIRQGDVYFIQQSRDNFKAIKWTNHEWDPNTRTVSHPTHSPVHLPFRAKAIRQNTLGIRTHGSD